MTETGSSAWSRLDDSLRLKRVAFSPDTRRKAGLAGGFDSHTCEWEQDSIGVRALEERTMKARVAVFFFPGFGT